MSRYTQIFYQIVFGTKHRKPTINPAHDTELFKYIYGITKEKKCKLYRINGIADHIHIFTDLHPTLSLSNFVKDIKVASSIWLKENENFPLFEGWQVGYSAFTYSVRERDMIINYVKKQKTHHDKENFYEEYKRMLIESGVTFEEKYLFSAE